jgi:DNA-binding transcriptional LysR family regulator
MLAHETFIFPTNYIRHHLHDSMMRICRDAGLVPNVRYHTDSVFSAVAMVSANLGVSMVYEVEGFRPPDVVFKKISGPNLDQKAVLSWRRGTLTPTAVRFLRLRQ